jgi:hypothetical protein
MPLALLLITAWLLGCPPNEKITRDQAWEIVKKNIFNGNPENCIVYVSQNVMTKGQEIKSWQQVYTVPSNFPGAWFFFVDDQPGANWGHQCRYIFVDADTGKYHIINALTPPDSMEGMIKIFPSQT